MEKIMWYKVLQLISFLLPRVVACTCARRRNQMQGHKNLANSIQEHDLFVSLRQTFVWLHILSKVLFTESSCSMKFKQMN